MQSMLRKGTCGNLSLRGTGPTTKLSNRSSPDVPTRAIMCTTARTGSSSLI